MYVIHCEKQVVGNKLFELSSVHSNRRPKEIILVMVAKAILESITA